MFSKNGKNNGFAFVELTVALAVLGVLLTVFALSLEGFRRFNHYQLTTARCIAAAQAQLDSIAVTGKPIQNSDFKRLWPNIDVFIHQSSGEGQLEGMELIRVTTISRSFRRKVKVQLCRYILPHREI